MNLNLGWRTLFYHYRDYTVKLNFYSSSEEISLEILYQMFKERYEDEKREQDGNLA